MSVDAAHCAGHVQPVAGAYVERTIVFDIEDDSIGVVLDGKSCRVHSAYICKLRRKVEAGLGQHPVAKRFSDLCNRSTDAFMMLQGET